MEHKPSSLLSNADCAAQLVGANTIFTISNSPNCNKPLVQTERAIFKNRANFGAKLFAAIFAPQKSAGLNLANSFTSAMRADWLDAEPFNITHKLFANIQIGKVMSGLQKCLWGIHFDLLQKKSLPRSTRAKAGLKNSSFSSLIITVDMTTKPVVCPKHPVVFFLGLWVKLVDSKALQNFNKILQRKFIVGRCVKYLSDYFSIFLNNFYNLFVYKELNICGF